jgi:hypothetical protein
MGARARGMAPRFPPKSGALTRPVSGLVVPQGSASGAAVAEPNSPTPPTSDHGRMTAGVNRSARLAGDRVPGSGASVRTLGGLVLGFGLIALVACDPRVGTPGLEPPVADGDSRSPAISPPTMFGNPGGVLAPPSGTGTAGSAAAPSTSAPNGEPNMPPPAVEMMGAGGMAMMPPTDPSPPSSADGGGGAAGSSSAGSGGLDLLPECGDEVALPLTAEGVCSFPLPEAVEVMPELAKIALISNGEFSLVERVDGPLDCGLLEGGFYFDRTESPTRITLCTQSCLRAGAAAEMQVVLVLGCPPPAP